MRIICIWMFLVFTSGCHQTQDPLSEFEKIIESEFPELIDVKFVFFISETGCPYCRENTYTYLKENQGDWIVVKYEVHNIRNSKIKDRILGFDEGKVIYKASEKLVKVLSDLNDKNPVLILNEDGKIKDLLKINAGNAVMLDELISLKFEGF
jgi:hypothetical protein